MSKVSWQFHIINIFFRLDDATDRGQKYQALYYKARKKTSLLEDRVETLQQSILELKMFAFNEETTNVLSKAASQIPAALFDRCAMKVAKDTMKTTYPASLRTFAFTLHSYSPAAYR